ncbi:MAG TPA: tol-pal system protein YbgF [Vicinamibacterales bacterium]|nr:tol-pal system protein YbgF [Acidobacteriota bacterium]HOC17384.1 tol-pal system protein YbgF [Vicinamibacterales bacterium]
MARTLLASIAALSLLSAGAAPALAASKEQQQMMADIRMLQAQTQALQLQLAALTEALKTVSAKIDEQGGATRKAFADQKVLVDAISGDLRVVREKVDDNNLRIGSVSLEIEALRNALPQPGALIAPAPGAEAQPPDAATDPAAPAAPAPVAPAQPPASGMSPQRLYDMAWADYAGGQYSLAIRGFEEYIKSFPKSELAGDAQFFIGETYYVQGQYREAVAAYDQVLASYPASKKVPDTYFKRGLALNALGQTDRARESWEYVLKNFPNSDAGRLARQRLDQLQRKEEDREE